MDERTLWLYNEFTCRQAYSSPEPDTIAVSTFPILELEKRAIEEIVLYPVLPVLGTVLRTRAGALSHSSHTLKTLVADWDAHSGAILASSFVKAFFPKCKPLISYLHVSNSRKNLKLRMAFNYSTHR